MRKILVGALAALAITTPFAPTAGAANPHFVRAEPSGPNSFGRLVVDFKLVGLGARPGPLPGGALPGNTVDLWASQTATRVCKDDDNNFHGDPEVAITLVGSSRPVSDNGQFTGSVFLDPAGFMLDCAVGQSVTLVEVSYTDVSISHQIGGEETTETSIPGTFSAVIDPDWTG